MFFKKKLFNLTKEEFSWILYDWANSAYALIVLTTFFPIFFKKVIAKEIPDNLSTSLLGYTNTIYATLIAVLSPVIGTISDYKNKKIFFFIFFFIGTASTLLISFVPVNKIVIALLIFLFSAIGFSFANLFYDSFLTDITDNKRMHWISSLGFGFGYLGSTIPFIITIVIISIFSNVENAKENSTRLAFLIAAAWWAFFSIPFFKNVKQNFFLKLEKNKNIIAESFKRIFLTFKEIKEYKKIFLFLLAYFFYIDGVDTIIKMAIPYALDINISLSRIELLLVILLIQIIAFPFAIFFGYIAKKYQNSIIYLLFINIFIYIFIVIFAFFVSKKIHFLIVALSVGICQGAVQSLSRSYFATIISKDKSGEFFGFYNIFGKFAAIMGPFLIAIITNISNIRYSILSLLPLFIIGGILLSFQKKIS